jgi:hypothetical protein
MDFNLNSFSSNLMLIALVLVSLCCLYLLYSNFTKVREIEELKGRVEDLKKIFLNQQMHNDENFSKINTALFQTLTNGQSSGQTNGQTQSSSVDIKLDNSNYSIGAMDKLDVNNEIAKEVSVELRQSVLPPTKIINIDTKNIDNLEGNTTTNNIIINKEGYISHNVSNTSEKITTENKKHNDNKEINIDLHDLDNLDDINEAEANIDTDMNMEELDLDDNCEEFDTDKLVSSKSESHILDKEGDIQITKDNLFNIDTVNITNAEIFDDLEDTLSIATAPIDETNDIINHNSNFNLDDIQDIQDIQDIDDIDNTDILETSDIKTVLPNVNVTKVEDIDLSELLNGNTNQTKKTESNQVNSESNELLNENKENIKTIEIDTPKTDYNSMPVKQLKDIAKSHGLKTTGTKQELVQLLLAFDAK